MLVLQVFRVVLQVLRLLASTKAREAPSLLRQSARQAWHHRWLCLLSVAVQVSVAESLIAPISKHRTELDLEEPALHEVLVGCRGMPAASRLPLRG